MFSKKIMPVAGIALISALLLTGCSTSNNSNNDTTPTPTSINADAGKTIQTGSEAVTTYKTFLDNSLLKAEKDGYVLKITSDSNSLETYYYMPSVSTSQLISTRGDNIPVLFPLADFPASLESNTLQQLIEDNSSEAAIRENNSFLIAINTQDIIGTLEVRTKNKLIDQMIFSVDGKITSEYQITYGLSAAEKKKAKKLYEDANNNNNNIELLEVVE